MQSMTHRERVLAALNHQEPDRAPMDLGAARFTTMVKPAYDRLRAKLGFGAPGVMLDKMQQIVEMDEAVLKYLDVDVRGFAPGAPDVGGDVDLDGDRYRDEWGVVRRRPEGCEYYELCGSPLAGAITSADVARYPWPDPTDAGRFRGLRERARELKEETDYAVVFNARFSMVHMTQYLRGFEDWYTDLAGNHDLFTCMMEATTEVYLEMSRRALELVGDLIDVVAWGDDVGLQDRPVCSPASYRKLIKPYHARALEMVRKYTSAKILYHSCGSTYALLNDFAEIGVNAVNPLQVTARHMEPAKLKAEFGGRLSFWGGIDTHRILPFGTPEQVRDEVLRMIGIMGKGGGYVVAAVHNVQPDVPPENVLAMVDAVRSSQGVAA